MTNPEKPTRLTVIISGLNETHHDWWECDTGIAYTISQTPSDGWQESGLHQRLYIYDLSDPAKPVFIRQFGLVGQQPDAAVANAQSCTDARVQAATKESQIAWRRSPSLFGRSKQEPDLSGLRCRS